MGFLTIEFDFQNHTARAEHSLEVQSAFQEEADFNQV
jgi:hypothetical protein